MPIDDLRATRWTGVEGRPGHFNALITLREAVQREVGWLREQADEAHNAAPADGDRRDVLNEVADRLSEILSDHEEGAEWEPTLHGCPNGHGLVKPNYACLWCGSIGVDFYPRPQEANDE